MSDMDDALVSAEPESFPGGTAEWMEAAADGPILESLEAPAPMPRGSRRGSRSAPVPLRRILEAVLFAVDHPVKVEELRLAAPEASEEEITRALYDLMNEYMEG